MTPISMPYQEVRPHIQSFDVLGCIGHYPISQTLSYFQHRAYPEIPREDIYSHVALILQPPSSSRKLLIESVESQGTRHLPLSAYVNDYNGTEKPYDGRLFILRHKRMGAIWESTPDPIRGKWVDSSIEMLGRRYDRDQIAKLLVRITLGLRRGDGDKEMVCSELVDILLRRLGVETPRKIEDVAMPVDFQVDPNWRCLFEIDTG